jgi:hypothetical protein
MVAEAHYFRDDPFGGSPASIGILQRSHMRYGRNSSTNR